jgi:hypothetical protein
MKRAGTVVVFALLLAMSRLGHADTLELAKGDVLSGKLTRFADGVVHFRTKMAGNVIIPIDEVVRLATDAPVVVKTKDGATLEGTVTIDRGQFIFTPRDKKRQTFRLTQIDSIKPAQQDNPTAEEPLRVSAESGVLWRSGDDDYFDAFGRIRLSTRLDRLLFDTDLFVERADADDFPRWLNTSTRLRFYPDSLWQPTLGFDFERDTDKALRPQLRLHPRLSRPRARNRNRHASRNLSLAPRALR